MGCWSSSGSIRIISRDPGLDGTEGGGGVLLHERRELPGSRLGLGACSRP
jgi:hypothetical protein